MQRCVTIRLISTITKLEKNFEIYVVQYLRVYTAECTMYMYTYACVLCVWCTRVRSHAFMCVCRRVFICLNVCIFLRAFARVSGVFVCVCTLWSRVRNLLIS